MDVWKYRAVTAWVLSVLLLLGVNPVYAQGEAPKLSVGAAVLADAETGKILYAENADEPLGIASMTKMMTEYLLFEAVERGELSWEEPVEISSFVSDLSVAPGLANVPLREGETYTVQELYEAMAIYSANAATVALAEAIGGSEGEFVRQMNAKAEELGLSGTNFVNSTGLSNKGMLGNPPEGTDPLGENVMTAISVAKLARQLLTDYPQVLETAKIPELVFREGTAEAITMRNWNFMLPGLQYEFEGVDGLKTGTTDFAGYCFTATAERDGRRLIAVVMDATDSTGYGSYAARFEAARQLLTYGFDEFTMAEIFPAGYQVPAAESLPVRKGKTDEVDIAAAQPLKMLIQKGDAGSYEPVLELDKEIAAAGWLEAGVEKGQTVGTLTAVSKPGADFGFLDDNVPAVPVVTATGVERASWPVLAFEKVQGIVTSTVSAAGDFIEHIFS
ncbi:D-alanyl-D-alanine carboxypeptidase family protein [Indiicoccus explosivorum]|uniref:D-alanyl-D-alanine carboxypeptidase family protein n=1 Tax=Indiicoccus explosivorum TaxID=1917864 RepID=UPI000B44C024|nr:D-alanyl-D-alanine carboxypeptidase family protein [Indiicoccus explosivorum]